MIDRKTTDLERQRFQEDGAVCLRDIFDLDWIARLAEGLEQHMSAPSPNAADNTAPGEAGRFWDDLCNWQRVPEYRDFLMRSPAAAIAGELMGSSGVRLFHDHVLVKEPGTAKPTPWHQDAPYYIVDGEQTCSLWIPLDPVSEDVAVRFVAGSHRWGQIFSPVTWSAADADYSASGLPPMPAIDDSIHRLLRWAVEPGDAIAFTFRTIHGAPGNLSGNRRRAFSARWMGDDVRFVERHGPVSPDFEGLPRVPGEVPDGPLFPLVWQSLASPTG